MKQKNKIQNSKVTLPNAYVAQQKVQSIINQKKMHNQVLIFDKNLPGKSKGTNNLQPIQTNQKCFSQGVQIVKAAINFIQKTKIDEKVEKTILKYLNSYVTLLESLSSKKNDFQKIPAINHESISKDNVKINIIPQKHQVESNIKKITKSIIAQQQPNFNNKTQAYKKKQNTQQNQKSILPRIASDKTTLKYKAMIDQKERHFHQKSVKKLQCKQFEIQREIVKQSPEPRDRIMKIVDMNQNQEQFNKIKQIKKRKTQKNQRKYEKLALKQNTCRDSLGTKTENKADEVINESKIRLQSYLSLVIELNEKIKILQRKNRFGQINLTQINSRDKQREKFVEISQKSKQTQSQQCIQHITVLKQKLIERQSQLQNLWLIISSNHQNQICV